MWCRPEGLLGVPRRCPTLQPEDLKAPLPFPGGTGFTVQQAITNLVDGHHVLNLTENMYSILPLSSFYFNDGKRDLTSLDRTFLLNRESISIGQSHATALFTPRLVQLIVLSLWHSSPSLSEYIYIPYSYRISLFLSILFLSVMPHIFSGFLESGKGNTYRGISFSRALRSILRALTGQLSSSLAKY